MSELKADNPQLQEVLASWQRDKEGINIADVTVYEQKTGKKLSASFGPPNNIFPADKLTEIFATLYSDFKSDTPIDKIKTYEDVLTFFRRLAVHAANKVKDEKTDEINDLFIVMELALKDGTEETRGLIVHFLEDFQTVFFNEELDFDLIKEKMHPLAMSLWEEIDQYWKSAAEYKKSKE